MHADDADVEVRAPVQFEQPLESEKEEFKPHFTMP